MLLLKSLPMGLILLIANHSSPSFAASSTHSFSRALHKLHGVAVKHTKSFARDLRVAFGGMLVTAPSEHSQHVVYCKPSKSEPLPHIGGGNGGGGNGTSPANSTATRNGGGSSARPTGTMGAGNGQPSATANFPPSPWKLTESHEGQDFFNGWSWYTDPDPTHGIVQYVDQNTAFSKGLAQINSAGNAVMRIETTQTVQNNRQSVRITTDSSFNGGLLVMDALHMPTGCGIWPAFWSNGPNWPAGGEIDIIEGVGDYTNNQATIHTDSGCTLSSSNSNTLRISGGVIGGTDCAALTTGNQGCGIRASTDNSFGAGFNSNGGGTYAMKWDTSGIAVYFFPRGSEPGDLEANAPQPDSWGNPQARWPADGCDPFKYFNNHHAIFDTTLCGDWAGGVWGSSGIPGQEQSCAARTGFSTCEGFVRARGDAMGEAYWEVRSVRIFQLSH